MPVVTAIKPQKNKKRVNIYLDGKFGFGLDLETFVKSGIKIEQDLTDEKIESIVKEGEFQSTYDKILRFATLRPRSKKEFVTWLAKYKVHESIRDELFNRLKRLELLDDKKFASWWVGQRLQFKNKSKRELIQELRIKGIDRDLISQLVSESISQVDQIKSAKKLIKKRLYKWDNVNDFEKRKKMFSYLSGKGFDYEVIKEVLGQLLQD